MAAGIVNIEIHHGGNFSKEGVLAYLGGQVSYFRNCDVDRLSYFELIEMVQDLGFNEGDKLFYAIPGYSVDVGVDQILDDESVLKMLRLAKPNVFLELYIQRCDQLGRRSHSHAPVEEETEDANMGEQAMTRRNPASNRRIPATHVMKPWKTRTFKCLMIGNPGTGKTTFMKRLLCEGFVEDYEPTTKPAVKTFQFRTSRSRERKRIRFRCYEYPMTEGFNDKFFKERDCINMDCAIIMCDITDESSMKHVGDWVELFESYGKEIPMVVCGNKADLIPVGEVKPIGYKSKSINVLWTPCSVKSLKGLWVPFCHIAGMLTAKPHEIPFSFFDDMNKRGLRM